MITVKHGAVLISPGAMVGNMMVFHLPITRDGETWAHKNWATFIDPISGAALSYDNPGDVIAGNIGLQLLVWGNF